MWPEVGHLALIVAAWVAMAQAVLPLWGSLSARRWAWQVLARPLAVLQLALIVLAFGALWPDDVGDLVVRSGRGPVACAQFDVGA